MVKTTDDVAFEMEELVKSVREAANNLKLTQEIYQASAQALKDNINANRLQSQQFSEELGEIKSLLREGFRLPPEPSASQD